MRHKDRPSSFAHSGRTNRCSYGGADGSRRRGFARSDSAAIDTYPSRRRGRSGSAFRRCD